jgi:hypothetical protein
MLGRVSFCKENAAGWMEAGRARHQLAPGLPPRFSCIC